MQAKPKRRQHSRQRRKDCVATAAPHHTKALCVLNPERKKFQEDHSKRLAGSLIGNSIRH
jgi:hypothetical protein